MAGFAVLFAPDEAPQILERDFLNLLHLTAGFKQLEIPSTQAVGLSCMAGKLDSPATLHPGFVHDEQSGSWLCAAGTVVALTGDCAPAAVLVRLLKDYIENGTKSLSLYDGQFALVVYNGYNQSLAAISDPVGLFSIFYSRRGSQTLISTSALAIAAHTQAAPDILAVEHFLRTGRLDADKTLWKSVSRLPGGTALHVSHSRTERVEYWAPTYAPDISRLSLQDALDQASSIFADTFEHTLQNEGKVWVDLTGGFDSRLVAMLVEKNKSPFVTYCMGPNNHPDVVLSGRISEQMGWEYVHTQLPAHWDSGDNAWFGQALGSGDGRATVLRLAVTLRGFNQRNSVIKTNMMGVGGENWRGYCWQIEKGNIGKTSQLNYPALLDNVFSPSIPLAVMRYDCTNEVRQELSDFIHELCYPYAELPNTAQIDRFEIGRDSGHGGAYISAVSGVERSLAPLCFKAVVNFAFSLNYRWKYPRQTIFIRSFLERENKRLAEIETTTGGPAIPIRITNIQKFWPLWKGMAGRAVSIGSQKVLGKPIHILAETTQSEYPLMAWRKAFYAYAHSEGMLNHASMRSGGLYRHTEFNTFVESALLNPLAASEFIERVISVEMAMRAVGSVID